MADLHRQLRPARGGRLRGAAGAAGRGARRARGRRAGPLFCPRRPAKREQGRSASRDCEIARRSRRRNGGHHRPPSRFRSRSGVVDPQLPRSQ
eukprot:6145509-Alexandrium_andersonii.AAC.1